MNGTIDLHLDFETYCDLDLTEVGVYRYVEHPSFRLQAAAWKIAGNGTRWEAGPSLHAIPSEVMQLLGQASVQGHAWNAAFEMAVLAHFKVPVVNLFSCTMQRALAYGLPGKLEYAAAALGTPHQKDMTGHRLMLKMCRPPKNGLLPPVWSQQDYDGLGLYCAGDVRAEADVAARIPELPKPEKALSALDYAMNKSGALRVDLDRVALLQGVATEAEKDDAARCTELTGGAVTSPGTQTARLMAWLKTRGLDMPDLARPSVEAALPHFKLLTDVKEVLEIRLRAARASVRKLKSMAVMAGPFGELQGQFQFCGAGRTGRWSGRGVQVQNLPRVPKDFDPDLFVRLAAVAQNNNLDVVSPVTALDAVSWSLRSCLKAEAGLMWGFDFSQIEARVLAWLAGQQDVLQVFRLGQDVYVWAAAHVGSTDRQLGKVLVLALGFGMGAQKLRETAQKQYGVTLTSPEAEAFKTLWRQQNNHIVAYWYAMEDAARAAIASRNEVFTVGATGVRFQCTAKTLQMRLPSGRVLYYHRPRVDEDNNICYWGVEVGQWMEQRTWGGKLAENATQAVARDVMASAMGRLYSRYGMVPVMTVHDELVYGITPDQNIETARQSWHDVACKVPSWCPGLPIAGESKVMSRYGVTLPP